MPSKASKGHGRRGGRRLLLLAVVDSGEKSTNDRGGGRSAEDALEAALKSDGVVGTIS